MTLSLATQSVPFGAFEIFQLTNGRKSIAATVRGWNASRSTRKVLKRLSGDQLSDIGLVRKDIAKFAV